MDSKQIKQSGTIPFIISYYGGDPNRVGYKLIV